MQTTAAVQDAFTVRSPHGLRALSQKTRSFAGITVRHLQHFNLPGRSWNDLSSPFHTLVINLQDYGGRSEARLHLDKPLPLDRQRPNALSFVPAGMTTWAYSDNIASVRELRLSFDGTLLQRQLDPDVTVSTLQDPRLMFQDFRMLQIAKLFANELDSTEEVNPLFGEGMALALLSSWFQSGAKPKARGLSASQLRRTTEYIHAHLDSVVTLIELAQLVGMSASQFARLFRVSTGVSPHRYQLQARIERAQERMLHTNDTLPAIALSVGYVDQSHFTRSFRNVTGATPNAWRKDRRQ